MVINFYWRAIELQEKYRKSIMSEILSLWNKTPAKEASINYVNAVINPESADFVPEPERIATLYNDGTMWLEKPVFVQVFSVIDRLTHMAESDHALLNQPYFKAAATGDSAYFLRIDPNVSGDIKVLMQIAFDSHAGVSQDDFMLMAKEFPETAKNPRFGVLYKGYISRWLSLCATLEITALRSFWLQKAA